MLGTWATVGRDYSGDGVADVNDPSDAIPAQARYMCDQLAQVQAALEQGRVSGDPVTLALAAYNAGLGNVLDAGGVPPFSETQHYVQVIQANAATYEAAAVTEAASPADGTIADALAWAQSIAADDSYRYVWGGEGAVDGGYDCSGLVQEYLARRGIAVAHLADTQARDPQGTTVPSLEQAQVGDLLFWGTGRYWHVAIYADDASRARTWRQR